MSDYDSADDTSLWNYTIDENGNYVYDDGSNTATGWYTGTDGETTEYTTGIDSNFDYGQYGITFDSNGGMVIDGYGTIAADGQVYDLQGNNQTNNSSWLSSMASGLTSKYGGSSNLSSLLSGLGSIASAAQQNDALQSSYADSLAFQEQMYNDIKANNQPYMDAGTSALASYQAAIAGGAPTAATNKQFTFDYDKAMDSDFLTAINSRTASDAAAAAAAAGNYGSGNMLTSLNSQLLSNNANWVGNAYNMDYTTANQNNTATNQDYANALTTYQNTLSPYANLIGIGQSAANNQATANTNNSTAYTNLTNLGGESSALSTGLTWQGVGNITNALTGATTSS